MIAKITSQWNGKLLREYLQQELKLSSRMISRLKSREQGILLNGVPVTVRKVLQENDILSLALEDNIDAQNENLLPWNISLEILYEDEDVIAVYKPSGMPTHPSQGHFTDTLANALVAYFSSRPFVFRAINRLDADTSGIVLVAKNAVAAQRLGAQMQKRMICKKYLAILDGALPYDHGEITFPIRRKPGSKILREVTQETVEGAMHAKTEYRVLWRGQGLCGVEAVPHTGRTHQLRVHFSHLGVPILYDPFYAKEVLGKTLCLHAAFLTFDHPVTGERIVLEAQMEERMKKIWESQKKS